MINGIIGGGSIRVTGGYISHPSFSMGYDNPATGAMRFNSGSQSVEVFNGSTWFMMNGGSPMVELSGAAEAALAWVHRKMNEEAELLKLAEEYPAIKDLMNQQKEIQHKIDMVVALVKEEVKI